MERTNKYYSEKLARATRILWLNGNVDPWHVTSVTSSPGPDQPVLFPVMGASHCAWMSSSHDSDLMSVKDARERIHEHVLEWLGPQRDEHVLGWLKPQRARSMTEQSVVVVDSNHFSRPRKGH